MLTVKKILRDSVNEFTARKKNQRIVYSVKKSFNIAVIVKSVFIALFRVVVNMRFSLKTKFNALNVIFWFKGIKGQKYCRRNLDLKCERCGRIFQRICKNKSTPHTNFCDSICWNLNEKATNIIEYRSINDWAVSFKNREGRRPSINDINQYFNVRNLPGFADKSLFRLNEKGYSFLESVVSEYISDAYIGLKVLNRKRPLKDPEGRRLEIDIFIEEISLGFEIQDFATHSRDNDTEISRFGETKKGPIYHEKKKRLAANAGIVLIEIWEDEILNGKFKKTVNQSIQKALDFKTH